MPTFCRRYGLCWIPAPTGNPDFWFKSGRDAYAESNPTKPWVQISNSFHSPQHFTSVVTVNSLEGRRVCCVSLLGQDSEACTSCPPDFAPFCSFCSLAVIKTKPPNECWVLWLLLRQSHQKAWGDVWGPQHSVKRKKSKLRLLKEEISDLHQNLLLCSA